MCVASNTVVAYLSSTAADGCPQLKCLSLGGNGNYPNYPFFPPQSPLRSISFQIIRYFQRRGKQQQQQHSKCDSYGVRSTHCCVVHSAVVIFKLFLLRRRASNEAYSNDLQSAGKTSQWAAGGRAFPLGTVDQWGRSCWINRNVRACDWLPRRRRLSRVIISERGGQRERWCFFLREM